MHIRRSVLSDSELPSDERPFEGLLGHARVHVAMVTSWSVHHVAMWRSLHGLLGVWLRSHHAHLHRVLGRLVHIGMVAMVAAVHHGLAHAVTIHGVERGHVHGVDVVGRRRHDVDAHVHAGHGGQCPGRRLHGHRLGRPAVHLLLVVGQRGRLGAHGDVAFGGHLSLDPLGGGHAHIALQHHGGRGAEAGGRGHGGLHLGVGDPVGGLGQGHQARVLR